ncbi:MAG: protein kinase [Acidobacteriota bacterium]|nr:protein kinase [Acidobacteriota bacterium]
MKALNNLTLNDLEFKERLGKGSYGVVYKALVRERGTLCAVKYANRKGLSSATVAHYEQALRYEFERAKDLDHPGVVRFYRLVEDESLGPVIIMEYVDGIKFDPKVSRTFREKHELTRQLADILVYFQNMKRSHNDLKPQNMLLTRDGRLKVLDFGLARDHHFQTERHEECSLGTLEYMAPEKLYLRYHGIEMVQEAGVADIYSFGVIVYTLYHGAHPFFRNKPDEELVCHKLTSPNPPKIPFNWVAQDHQKQVVRDRWAQLFHKVLANKPWERYQSAADFLFDFEAALRPEPYPWRRKIEQAVAGLRSAFDLSFARAAGIGLCMSLFAGPVILQEQMPAPSSQMRQIHGEEQPARVLSDHVDRKDYDDARDCLGSFEDRLLAALIEEVANTDGDYKLTQRELARVIELRITQKIVEDLLLRKPELMRPSRRNAYRAGKKLVFNKDDMIQSLNGIEIMPNLRSLYIEGQDIEVISSLSVSLQKLEIERTKLRLLDAEMPAMRTLIINDNFPYRDENNRKVNPTVDLTYLSDNIRELTLNKVNLISLELANYKQLERLTLQFNDLTMLEGIGTSVTWLDITGNHFSVLPELHDGLQVLRCSKNKELHYIENLPAGLTEFICRDSGLLKIGNWGGRLVIIDVTGNQLENLPRFPDCTREIWIADNEITELRNLPSSLAYFYAQKNCLGFLPEFSSTANLKFIDIRFNHFTDAHDAWVEQTLSRIAFVKYGKTRKDCVH